MNGPERRIEVARGWVEKAESDLRTADIALKAGPSCPTDAVAFHAQQCAEKHLKGLLTFNGADVPRIHDIAELIVASGIQVDVSVAEQRRLTDYATLARYPGDYEPVELAEARRAVRLARKVRSVVRKALPREALKTVGR